MRRTATTAHWIAAARARESARPDHLFIDPYAKELAGQAGRDMMAASEAVSGRENPFIPVRVRWFDDRISALVGRLDQVVLLGAGLDTRAFRLPLPAGVDWYELDRDFGAKEEVLRGHLPVCRRHLVQADVRSPFDGPLLGAGFAPARPTLWVAEGLLYYLLLEDVIAVLRRAAGMSAPGSTLLADLMPASVADLAPELMKRRGDLPPPFGHDDPAALFRAGGWRSVEATPLGAPGANFGRVGPPTGGPAVHLVAATRPATEPAVDPSTGDGVG